MILYNKPSDSTWYPSPDVSELFMMIKSESSPNSYCEGGDFEPAINDMQGVGTFETESNFPYSKVNDYSKGANVDPILKVDNYYTGY